MRSATASSSSPHRWPYQTSVMVAEACPSTDRTPLTEAPEAMASDAAV